MSKLDYCFESHKSPNVHAINKRICYDLMNNTPHQKFCFITYLLKDEQELSLGMLICLQCIYNFWLFHVVILSFLDVLQSFYSHLYHFLVLTYWHCAQCQLLFSTCFLHRRKSIPNGVQMQRNFTEIFLDRRYPMGQGCAWGGGAPRGAQPTRARQEAQAHPGGLCSPRVPPGPPLCSINTPIFQKP